MRKLASLALLLAVACTTATPPPSPPPAPEPPPGVAGAVVAPDEPPAPFGLTVDEEARILALEDRREFDAATVERFATHTNSLHRQRIALALGRIGGHTFLDANGNGERDAGERQAGVAELIRLTKDASAPVAETAVFALGEIGDTSAVDALLGITSSDGRVEAEAVEALSKMAKQVPFARYAQLVRSGAHEGTRARATRFLFRFDTDEASALATEMLDSTSSLLRQEAAYSLARRTYAPSREKLELLVNDPNTLTRAYAITALGRIGAPQSAPLVVTALGDIHPWVRTNAILAIGRLGAKDATVLRSDDLPRLIAILEDPDTGVRSSAIDTLGYYATQNQTARQRLMDLSKNGSRWERELTAAAIAKHFGAVRPADIPADLTAWGKVRVLEQSAAMKEKGAELRRKLAADPDPMVRAQALGAIPDEEATANEQLIVAALSEADVIIRGTAIDRYSKVTAPAEKKIEVLRMAYGRTLQDRDLNDARLAAINAIGDLDHPDREAFLRSLLHDGDPVVRRIAADLIEQKLKKPRPQFTPLPVTRPASEYAEIVQWARQPHTATIHMTRGVVEMALLPQDAPMTAWNFAQLAKRGYFDNSTFMRVVPNFVVQGGDPRNDQNGGPGYSIRDEINLQKYTRGAVGMALSGPDTGGSQFFITHSPQPHLDGGYTIFGRVYDGMGGVVDFTERGDKVETIKIDEHVAVGEKEIGAVLNVSLPTEVGPIASERVIGVVTDYRQLRDAYAADESVVEMIAERMQPQDRVEVYMGTWCPDSQREVPKFLKIHSLLKDKYGKELPVAYVAVDRSKSKPANLLAGKHVEKIATFIYYRGGEELGRIVETPQGVFEDDLLGIVAKTSAQ